MPQVSSVMVQVKCAMRQFRHAIETAFGSWRRVLGPGKVLNRSWQGIKLQQEAPGLGEMHHAAELARTR